MDQSKRRARSCRQIGKVLPEHVFEIFHRFQHLVEELLTTFITQMKSAIIGNKLLILPAALKKSLGGLGRCIFLKILAYCNTVIVFFGRLQKEGRAETVRGSGGQKVPPPPKKRSPEKQFVLGTGAEWQGCGSFFVGYALLLLFCFGGHTLIIMVSFFFLNDTLSVIFRSRALYQRL